MDSFFENKFKVLSFPNNLVFSKEMFINRMLSASYSLTEQDKNFSEYINVLEQLFNKYSIDGVLTMPNETIAYIGTN